MFPKEVIYTIYGKDTVDWEIPESEYKILIYVDSIGCKSCKVHLDKWKQFYDFIHTNTDQTVPFLFFFHAENNIEKREIQYLLESDDFDLPICIDTKDELNTLNKFPYHIAFQTFLLDRNNRVKILGNPIHDSNIKQLYINQLIGNTSSTYLSKTKVLLDESIIDMGTLKKLEKEEAIFRIQNVGDIPLVILDANTSCGCVKVSFDSQPAETNEILEIKVEMIPKNSGFFEETITLKCNTEQKLELKIKGQTL